MAKQIYSFTKIEKKRTHAGIITSLIGVLLIIALLCLIAAAVYLSGEMSIGIAAMGMFTFLVSIANYWAAKAAKEDDDTFGKFLRSGFVISSIALWLHVLIILIGIGSVIM